MPENLDIKALAREVIDYLSPHLVRLEDGGLGSEEQPVELRGAETLWRLVGPVFREQPDLHEELAELRDNPADLELVSALAVRLRRVLAGQADLAASIETVLSRARSAPAVRQSVSGSGGAVVGAHGAAAGQDGIAVTGGTIHGPLVTGGVHLTVPPARKDHDLEPRLAYLQDLIAQCQYLPLRGLDPKAADPASRERPMRLAQVYVDLDTTAELPTRIHRRGDRSAVEMRDIETRRVGVVEAVAQSRKIVVLGEPGSGKSTFLSCLALHLAARSVSVALGDHRDPLTAWPPDEVSLLPIPVTVRHFARTLPRVNQPAEPRLLWDFIVERLRARNLSSAEAVLDRALHSGHTVVLLDGFDEVPSSTDRGRVNAAVEAFVGAYLSCRFVATCRTLSYQDPALQLRGFAQCELAPLDDDKIGQLLAAWFGELAARGRYAAERIEAAVRCLSEAVRRPDLVPLARNPLLLTVMALVDTHKGRLPDARALVYQDAIDLLLWRWEELRSVSEGSTAPLRSLLKEIERQPIDLERVMRRLAFSVQERGPSAGPGRVADIGEPELVRELATLHPHRDRGWSQRVVTAIQHRAGLLVEREPGSFAFPHRTFQEFLAGVHASENDSVLGEVLPRAGDPGRIWRQVVLLATGYLVHVRGSLRGPVGWARELCPAHEPTSAEEWRKVWLAGEVLLEIGVNRVKETDLGRELLDRVPERLVSLLRSSALAARERAEAGAVLARLGDPRLEVTSVDRMALCEVAAGTFRMGEERAAHEVDVAGFAIGKWPVTCAQFAQFVADDGYADPRWWEGLTHPDGPSTLPAGFDGANQPVVNVTWYEAVAFTRWLTARWRASSKIRPDQSVVLPSEAEWEKAARGGTTLAEGEPNRWPPYPWGDHLDPERANCIESGIGRTSAVGCFPNGASPCGAEDLLGSVWERTRSEHRAYPYVVDDGRERDTADRDTWLVVRGGAFGGDQRLVRSGARGRLNPDLRSRGVGFRVIVSPP